MENYPLEQMSIDIYKSLEKAYKAVLQLVQQHQGDKGFILTDNDDLDSLYAMVYIESNDCNLIDYIEYHIKAIRANNDSLEIVYDGKYTKYTEDDINELSDDEWYDVLFDDYVFFAPTILSILENIEQYINE